MQGKTKTLLITGPAGNLEAELFVPEQHRNQIFVMCHPHPLYQGNMDNKVVTTLVRAMSELGFISLRFNYRGVGQSEGSYAEAIGETEDALAVLDYLQKAYPDHSGFVLGGFSFGGCVAYQTAFKNMPKALILISPGVSKISLDAAPEPICPLLVIQGASDEVVPASAVYDWLKTRKLDFTLRQLADTSHFFHGKLIQLRSLCQNFIKEVLA